MLCYARNTKIIVTTKNGDIYKGILQYVGKTLRLRLRDVTVYNKYGNKIAEKIGNCVIMANHISYISLEKDVSTIISDAEKYIKTTT